MRGLEHSFQRTPLRKFRGRLVSITGHMMEGFSPPRLEVLYNFEEVEVMKSTVPYDSRSTQISILHSDRKQSAMGVLNESIDKLLNLDESGQPIPKTITGEDGSEIPNAAFRYQKDLVGKMQTWEMTGGPLILQRARECWEVVEIEEEAPAPPPQKRTVTKAKAASPKGPCG